MNHIGILSKKVRSSATSVTLPFRKLYLYTPYIKPPDQQNRRVPAAEEGAPAGHLRAAGVLPSVDGEAAPRTEEEAEMVGITPAVITLQSPPTAASPRLRPASCGRTHQLQQDLLAMQRHSRRHVDAEKLAAELEQVSVTAWRLTRQLRGGGGSGEDCGSAQRRGDAILLIHTPRVHV